MADIEINIANNGAVLVNRFNDNCLDDSEEVISSTYVYEFSQNNLKGLQELLADIKSLVEPINGRYDKERLYLVLANGDKYEGDDKDKECPLCLRDY